MPAIPLLEPRYPLETRGSARLLRAKLDHVVVSNIVQEELFVPCVRAFQVELEVGTLNPRHGLC
jgi:hypothetical protein